MFEFEKSDNRTFTIDGRECTHTHYIIHADHVTDLNDDFVSKLRDVINDIADEFAGDDGSFTFADCRDALRGVYKVRSGEFISSDWDERKFARELDELRGVDRSKFAWLMTYSRLGYEDNKARSAFNERIIGGFLVDRCVHDELVLRGYDDDRAWEKASGCYDKMWDSLTECGLADCAEYTFDDDVLRCIECAIKLFA